MEMEVGAATGAAHSKKNGLRLATRSDSTATGRRGRHGRTAHAIRPGGSCLCLAERTGGSALFCVDTTTARRKTTQRSMDSIGKCVGNSYVSVTAQPEAPTPELSGFETPTGHSTLPTPRITPSL